jgi:hypothetical protein
MKVNNVNGTSENICKCGSWLAHWKNFSGKALSSYCDEKKCTAKPSVGAHVQKDSTTDRGWYIVPLCDEHNRQTGKSVELVDNAVLVSASVSQTCGRK